MNEFPLLDSVVSYLDIIAPYIPYNFIKLDSLAHDCLTKENKIDMIISMTKCNICHQKYSKYISKENFILLEKEMCLLKKFAGIEKIKELVVKYVILFFSNYESFENLNKNILIIGKPNTGKTDISLCVAKIFELLTNSKPLSKYVYSEDSFQYNFSTKIYHIDNLHNIGYGNEQNIPLFIGGLNILLDDKYHILVATCELDYYKKTLSRYFSKTIEKFIHIVSLNEYTDNQLFDIYRTKIENNFIEFPQDVESIKNLFIANKKKFRIDCRSAIKLAIHTIEIYHLNTFNNGNSTNILTENELKLAFAEIKINKINESIIYI